MNVELLLQPLAAGSERCGEDLIFSSDFDAIREARRFDDPSLSQGEWVTQIKEAEWDKVINRCTDILTGKSKDLRVAGWLTEASGKTRGLAGLADGFRLLGGLCETYWDDVHPRAEDGDLDQRTGALEWLLNQSVFLIRETPLTRSPKGDFSLLHQESARTSARNSERHPEMAGNTSAKPRVSLDAFDAALKDTPHSYFKAGMESAEALKTAMQGLQVILDRQMGEYAPSFTPAYDALDDVLRFHRRHGGGDVIAEGGAAEALAPQYPEQANATPTTANNPGFNTGGRPASRAQAIRQLQDIAAFFRDTEPHSPVAYLADKAARWGSMPLHTWLQSVVKDDATLARVEELLGIERPPAEAGES
ncbi:MAG: type VI secretion system protein TssA [Betaproteobacteria bacterium HGW-Betaproteobacteria-7]|jgi:type VI secretion system protein ImpA|nr:MAG: type VI secretion system protein TssA [Betaproteobacteria bacterium HGW-Betaproteobacteria-7]